MKKDIIIYIEDICDSIKKIEEYTNALTKEEFSDGINIQDAVLMRFIVIGESANKIPISVRKKHKVILWRKIINLRNIIAHDYSSVNINRIWKIIQEDLPVFKKQILKLFEETLKQ